MEDFKDFDAAMNAQDLKGFDVAIKTCQGIYESLESTLKEVQRLNKRFNSDVYTDKYNDIVANMRSEDKALDRHRHPEDEEVESKKPSISNGLPKPRSFCQVDTCHRKIHYKYIKTKREMDILLNQFKRIKEIANRQKGYTHMSLDPSDHKSHVCRH